MTRGPQMAIQSGPAHAQRTHPKPSCMRPASRAPWSWIAAFHRQA